MENVVQEGMVPIEGSAIQDGVYSIAVDSSSSMFKITACELTVEGGQMTAVMHMGGKGYLKLFMGTGEEAVAANEDDCIPFEENAEGEHTFTVPVEALDKGIPCAAFSKSKEMWYDRTLVFRADSLPMDAFQEGAYTKVESLSPSRRQLHRVCPVGGRLRQGQRGVSCGFAGGKWRGLRYHYLEQLQL